MEGDPVRVRDDSLLHFISIHSLRMEGDWSVRAFAPSPVHFNPLPPHGGRPGLTQIYTIRFQISIHSLRMEGDEETYQLDP